MNQLKITCPSWKDGTAFPEKHTGKKGASPEIWIEGLDSACKSLAVILDQTSQTGKPIPYWLIWNIPPISVIPENIPACCLVESLNNARQGVAKGINRYFGPKKSFVQFKKKHYTLTVYALDTELDLIFSAERHHLIRAMENHILQKGELEIKL